MEILRYFKFISQILIRKWAIWLFVGLYFAILLMNMYFFPGIINKQYIVSYSLKILSALAITFAMLASITMVLVIFKTPMDDGTDLLVLSKPISRSQIIWTKILYLWMFIILIAILSLLISLPTKSTIYNHDGSANAIIIGSFVGTLVVYLLWSSIALVLAIFLNKLQVSLICIMAQFILLLFTVVSSIFSNSVSNMQRKDNLILNGICLVGDPHNNNQRVNYQWGSISLKDSAPVTRNTKFNGVKIGDVLPNMADFNTYAWKKIIDKSNTQAFNYVDIDYQLASLYSYYSRQFINDFNASALWDALMWRSELSRYFIPKIEVVNLDSILDSIGAKSLKIPYINDEYCLVSNTLTYIEKSHDVRRLGTKNYFTENAGSKVIHTNLEQITFPIPSFNLSTDNWNTKTFNSFAEFAKFWFYDNAKLMLNFTKENQNKSFSKWTNEYAYLPWNVMSTYLAKQKNLDINMDKHIIINEWIYPLRNMMMDFQLWTYNFLQEYSEKIEQYPWVGNDELFLMMTALNHFDYSNLSFNAKALYANYFGTPREFLTDLVSKNKTELNKKWYRMNSQFVLVPRSALETFSIVKLNPTFDSESLLAGYLTLAIVTFAFGAALYTKKDFR